VLELQQAWKKSLQWVDEQIRISKSSETRRLMATGRAYVESLRWKEDTRIPGADGRNTTTVAFTTFLSHNAMMRTDHVNMMFAHLSERSEGDEPTDSMVVIETLRFMHEIERAKTQKDWNTPSKRFLQRLEERILAGDLEALVFPVHMPVEKHWITMRIDFRNQEIAFGEYIQWYKS